MAFAFVSLVSSDAYLPGALAQVAALRELHPEPSQSPELPFQTVCLVTPESLDINTIRQLRKVYDHVVGVEILEQDNPAGLKLLGRPDLTTVLTKLHVFRLTQYQKIIFLDADVLPIRPMSHLFALPHEFSAAPDVGWPDIFNSGVLVLSPGEDKFEQLNNLIQSKPSWDGGDQGILNEWRGGDWNRLSFTYNTTPTAAYTYAPAYERYGSQIKAIHFIGPNKPWNSIPFRTLNSRRQPDSSDSTQRAYDYDSLINRWFDVYDRHYHTETPVPKTPFQVDRYVSAWDQPVELRQSVSVPSVLDLDELKRLTMQGLNASTMETRPGEGTYQSLPLQGRVDLMRPRKEPEVAKPLPPPVEHQRHEFYIQMPDELDQFPSDSFSYEETLATPTARQATLGDGQTRWHTLPTPGPSEVPSSPRLRKISLPSTPSALPMFPTPTPDFYASESDRDSLLLSRADVEHHHSHHSPTHEHHHHHHHHEGHKRHHNQPEEARPRSPPMLTWNPAIEPPPNTTPTVNAFPANTYFSNIWDQTPSRQNDHNNAGPSPPDSGGFFEPPPSSTIPEPLLKQGHYRNVTGESSLGTTPSPDRKKVKPIFPWEEGPRIIPGRVFPDSDAPPPSLFLSPDSQSQTSTTTLSTPEARGSTTRPALLSPLHGLPATFSYSNAWDNVPSIQKYASLLVKSPQPLNAPPALAPAFEEDAYRKGRKKTRDEKAEMSSRDGDDEDNADDEDDEEEDGPAAKWDDEEESEAEKKRRSRRASVVTASSLVKGSGGGLGASRAKEYRSRGVQTVVVEKRSMGVQVETAVQPTTTTTAGHRQEKHLKRGSASARRHWAPTTGMSVVAPVMTTRDVKLDPALTVNTLSAHPHYSNQHQHQQQQNQHESKQKMKTNSPSVSPTPRSPIKSPPREFIGATSRTAHKNVSPPQRPSLRTSTASSSSISTVTPNTVTGIPNVGYTAPTLQEQRALSVNAATPTATSPGPSFSAVVQDESVGTGGRPLPLSSAAPRMSRHRSVSEVQSYAGKKTGLPNSIARKPSNESSFGSSASSVGPLSPADGHALLSPANANAGVGVGAGMNANVGMRKGTRVWDPARGIELFKRGSEEVLARFLKMGSWEDEAR